MKKLKLVYFAVILNLFLGCQSANTKENLANSEIDSVIKEFFEVFKNKDSESAVDYIFKTNPDISSAQLIDLKNKLSSLRLLAGRYSGYELITVQKASKSFLYYSYLVRFEKQPVRFIFIFYKPTSIWKIYKFKYDDQIDSELEQMGKVYLL